MATAIFGKLALEPGYFFTKNKVAPLDNPGDRCFDFLRDRLTLCPQVDQRYCSTKIRETAQEVQRVVRRGYFRSVNLSLAKALLSEKFADPKIAAMAWYSNGPTASSAASSG
jgi:hypothetical protein